MVMGSAGLMLLLLSGVCSHDRFSNNGHCALHLPAILSRGDRVAFQETETDGDTGQCISYDSVDEAFFLAKTKVGLNTPPREYNLYSLGQLGTALQETSRILSDRYSLSAADVILKLPLIDTFRTRIADFCPRFLRSKQHCGVVKYRRHDGSCNNLRHPTWGATLTAFHRFLPPNYADGVGEPRASRRGFPLPNPRSVSAHVHRDGGLHDHTVTLLFVVWGQLLDHDLTFTAETRDPMTLKEPDCCFGLGPRHSNCLAVKLPPQDQFFRNYQQTCMNLLRSLAGVSDDCRLGPRVQINTVTSYIDGSMVYGSNVKMADNLRLLQGGLMRTLPVFKDLGLSNMLPLKLDHPDDGCIRTDKDIYCFLAGDSRGNEQIVLTVLQTMLVRQHNILATQLYNINPHWDDEKLYQESRHILAALLQHITFTEFLPLLLGKNTMQEYKLNPSNESYSEDKYDPDVNPTVTSSFITAAFRFGHSLLPNVVERWSSTHKFIGSQRLSEVLKRPFNLYKPGWYDQYVLGLINQVAQSMDSLVTQEVTNHLFQQSNQPWGMDLASINLQRAREHGVPSYNQFREWCGLTRMDNFSSLLHVMANSTVHRYNDMYDHPDDIDLWSAGVAENSLPGSMVGPTFNCIIARTFKKLKIGDRFWYENKNLPNSFTPDQLSEIRKVRLSRLLCDTSDEVETVQIYSMVLPDPQLNPRVSCKSKILHQLDLSKWKEDYLDKKNQDQHLAGDDGNSDNADTKMNTLMKSFVRFPGYFS